MKYQNYIIYIILISASAHIHCSKDYKPLEPSNPFVYYMEFDIGNTWTYNHSSFQGDSHGYIFEGVEVWKVIHVEGKNDSSKFVQIETKCSGTRSSISSGASKNVPLKTDTLTIEISEGLIKLFKSSGSNSNLSYLESFLRKTESQTYYRLSIYQPMVDDGIFDYKYKKKKVEYSVEFSYSLNLNYGFTFIKSEINNNGWFSTMTIELVDFHTSSE